MTKAQNVKKQLDIVNNLKSKILSISQRNADR